MADEERLKTLELNQAVMKEHVDRIDRLAHINEDKLDAIYKRLDDEMLTQDKMEDLLNRQIVTWLKSMVLLIGGGIAAQWAAVQKWFE